ncbi:uncharacterized protein DS421_11g338040 [Arachis hypogaea]|nr:uncharacterized protein DS421_11g338040 [Arachis hypogaea]
MACHLKAEAWHANYWNQDKIMGVVRQPLGMARWYKFPERMKEANYMGRATWYRRRGMPLTILYLGVPLKQPGVACQCHSESKEVLGHAT